MSLVHHFEFLEQLNLLLLSHPQRFLNIGTSEGLSIGLLMSVTIPLLDHKDLLSNLPKDQKIMGIENKKMIWHLNSQMDKLLTMARSLFRDRKRSFCVKRL